MPEVTLFTIIAFHKLFNLPQEQKRMPEQDLQGIIAETLSKIDDNLIANLLEEAEKSERKRAHYNIHKSFDEPVQKVICAMFPESYVPPHRHINPKKSETFVSIRGTLYTLLFDNSGNVIKADTLDGSNKIVTIPEGVWHSTLSFHEPVVSLEIKAGPYIPPDKEFASFAPDEKSQEAKDYLLSLKVSLWNST